MADERQRVVRPPYICNWCGEKLHDRYQKHIYNDNDGKQYCSQWCRDQAEEAIQIDWEILRICDDYDNGCEEYGIDYYGCWEENSVKKRYCPILGRSQSLSIWANNGLRHVPGTLDKSKR